MLHTGRCGAHAVTDQNLFRVQYWVALLRASLYPAPMVKPHLISTVAELILFPVTELQWPVPAESQLPAAQQRCGSLDL